MKNNSKLVNRVFLLGLAFLLALTLTACKNKNNIIDNSKDTIEIFAYDAGYGLEWLYEMAKKFESKTNYAVVIKTQGTSDVIESMISAGPSNTTTDLFIVGEVWNRYIDKGGKVVSGYDYCLEPLDSVYNTVLSEEGITIKDKMFKTSSNFYKMEVEENGEYVEHYYAMPWASGFSTLMYNKSLFTNSGLLEEPRTTDELMEYCDILKSHNYTPFIYSAVDDYNEYLAYIWWAQYSTLKGIDNFFNGKVNDLSIPNPTESMKIFDDMGLYNMLRVFEKLINPATNNVDELVESYKYTTAQAKFFSGMGAMMPCGDWLENEMKKSSAALSSENISPMMLPIISALSDKLSYWEETGSYSEVENTISDQKKKEYDEKLRALVDYIDKKTTTLPSGTTNEDVEIVRSARNVRYSIGNLHSMVIPAYATAKQAAKEFLIFMASNEGLEIYLNNTNGCALPYNYDFNSWSGYETSSNFSKKRFELMKNAEYLPFFGRYKTVYLGGLGIKMKNFSLAFGSQDAGTRVTAKQYVDLIKEDNKNMEYILKTSGLY